MRKYTQKNFNDKPVSRKYAVSGEPGPGMVLYSLDPAGYVYDIVFGRNTLVTETWNDNDDSTLNSVPVLHFVTDDDRGNTWSGTIAPASGNPENLILTELNLLGNKETALDRSMADA